jgi:hypothetical protein
MGKRGRIGGFVRVNVTKRKASKTPNQVLFLVAVTFNTSCNGFIINMLKEKKE